MSTQATIRNIAVNPAKFSLSAFSLQGDHVVPEGAKVMELKGCENCTCTFAREKKPLEARKVANYNDRWAKTGSYSVIYVDRGQRYCKSCMQHLLLPLDQMTYKEQLLPILQQTHRGSKLPRYDDSLLPKEQRRIYTQPVRVAPERRKRSVGRRVHKDWQVRLMEAFTANGAMTYEAMQDVVGNIGGPNDTSTLLNHAGFKLQRIGSAPRRGVKGPQPGLFLPVAMAQEYFKNIASVGGVQ